MVDWEVALQYKDSAGAAIVRGESASTERAAHELIDKIRTMLPGRQHDYGGLTIVHIDAVKLEIVDVLDESVPTETVAEQILAALSRTKSSVKPPAESHDRITSRRARLSTRAGAGGVSGQLDRITTWARTHLGRAAFAPAVDADALATAQQLSEVHWPRDLVDLYTHANGSDLPILPGHDLLPLERSSDVRRLWLDIMADQRERHPEMVAAFDPDALGTMPAGTATGIFLPQFVPIADRDGATLVIDTRHGDLFGCVTEYTAEGATDEGPLWVSLAAMLTDLADSLETGTEFLGDRPSIVADKLVWSAQ